ncbi:hypothetical protein [Endozoicomonas sp. 4G]|uniref:hypothetical protein n=1 Tax=Endozoicomonas sp. 4G TaxID=2872754 RepID=UPI002078EB95|nr:hypothetical protein [Endozoicomonas sp. 4G]
MENQVSKNLETHKQTHLPADQRPKRKAYDQPPSNDFDLGHCYLCALFSWPRSGK